MTRTLTLPPGDPKMWRRLIARTHPDAGGDHELFIWTGAIKAIICDGELQAGPRPADNPSRERSTGNTDRVPFDQFADFEVLTSRALSMADAVAEPYAFLLRLVADCLPASDGSLLAQQRCGATYKQLAAFGHGVGMSGAERAQWYDVCRSIPLSQRHVGHILSRLKRRAA